MEQVKKIYVPIPKPDVYYGIKVDKNTKLEFKNELIKQKLKNLVLYSEYEIITDDFKSEIKNELYLKEGDLLLLEEEKRGYFKPVENIGSIDQAIEEMNFLKEQISKCEV